MGDERGIGCLLLDKEKHEKPSSLKKDSCNLRKVKFQPHDEVADEIIYSQGHQRGQLKTV